MKNLILILTLALGGCTHTEYKPFEGRDTVFEGVSGTKVIVYNNPYKGRRLPMDFWDNGEPPRKFKVLGIVEQSHSSPSDYWKIADAARNAGGDAVIQLGAQSRISVRPVFGVSKFAVIKYLD